MPCRLPLTGSMTGACTMRTEPLLGTSLAVTAKPGQTSPSREAPKAVRSRTRRPTICSTATRSTSLAPCRPPVTPSLLLSRSPTPSTYPTRLKHGPPSHRFRTVSAVSASRSSGLGGTGAYLLDLIAKTPVSEIHLFDPDCVDWHTLKRALARLLPRRLSSSARDRCSRSITIIPSMRPSGTASIRILSEWIARQCSPSFCRITPSTLPSCA